MEFNFPPTDEPNMFSRGRIDVRDCGKSESKLRESVCVCGGGTKARVGYIWLWEPSTRNLTQ